MVKIMKLMISSLLEPRNLPSLSLLFRSSVDDYIIKYAYYIGVGDTDFFKKVLESKTYGDDLI